MEPIKVAPATLYSRYVLVGTTFSIGMPVSSVTKIGKPLLSNMLMLLTTVAFAVRTQKLSVFGKVSNVTVATVPFRMCHAKRPE